MLGNGYVGIVPQCWEALDTWNVTKNIPPFVDEFQNVEAEDVRLNTLYIGTAENYLDVPFGQCTTFGDALQIVYNNLLGGSMIN